MNRAVALLLALANLAACDLVPRFGGAFRLDTLIPIGTAGNSSVRLVLGQYGPEVAGHLAFPELASCPCVYVKGTLDGDKARFEPQPTPGCTLVFKRGEFELVSSDLLRGELWRLEAGQTSLKRLTDEFDLAREAEQAELGADDLRGCGE